VVLFSGGLFLSGFNVNLSQSQEGFSGFANALYLSTITMSTVGYGDLTPGGVVARLVACLEGVSGILFAAMFLVSMQRRYAGR
jgi:hypothetical protein